MSAPTPPPQISAQGPAGDAAACSRAALPDELIAVPAPDGQAAPVELLPLDVVSPSGDGAEPADVLTLRGPDGTPVATVSSRGLGSWPSDAEPLRRLNEQIELAVRDLAASMAPAFEKARAAMVADLHGPLPRCLMSYEPLRFDAIFRGPGTLTPRIAEDAMRLEADARMKEILAKLALDSPFGIKARLGMEPPTKHRAVGIMNLPGPSRVSLLGKNGKREKIDLPANPNRRMRAALRAGAGLY